MQPKIRSHTADVRNGEALLDDLLGMRFLIVSMETEPQTWLTPESGSLWRRLGGERIVIASAEQARANHIAEASDIQRLVATDDLFAGWMRQQRCAAAVVRPDRYVFGTADDAIQLNRLVAAVARHVLGIA